MTENQPSAADISGYSIEQLVKLAADGLFGLSDSPKLDAELLLSHSLDCSRSYLYTWPEKIIPTEKVVVFRELLQFRQKGYPIAHLLGYREFWGLTLKVTQDTLIPRPDTEVLVETALQLNPNAKQILDMGTGSGAIALALKSELPNTHITAIDFSAAALEVAKQNSQTLNLTIDFMQSNWFERLPAGKQFDLIVSNPPYIEDQDEHLQQGDIRFEPISALTSGTDGLEAITQIVTKAPDFLQKHGWLVIEHGYNQALAVQQIFSSHGFQSIKTQKDYGDNDRVTFGQWQQE